MTFKDKTEFQNYVKDCKLLIITATEIEKTVLHQYLKPLNGEKELITIGKGSHTYFFGRFGNYGAVHVACGDMGSMSEAASILTTTQAIEDCNPLVVIMPGIAFGKNKKKQKIGEVLVAESIISYEQQRQGTDKSNGSGKIVYRGKPATADSLLINRVKNFHNWSFNNGKENVTHVVGAVLSGEKLIDNEEARNSLFEQYSNAIGGEMEGIGMYNACKKKNVPHWILAKGICDWADGRKGIKKDKRQTLAANASISFFHALFSTPYFLDDTGLKPILETSKDQNEPGITAFFTVENHPRAEQDCNGDLQQELTNAISDVMEMDDLDMSNHLQTLIKTYLNLNDVQKLDIIKQFEFQIPNLESLTPYEKDKAFLQRLKDQNLLGKLWEVMKNKRIIHDTNNPFEK